MSEENLISRTTGEIELLQIQSASRLLNCLTFTHDLGLNQLLTALVSGSTLRIVQQALPGDIFSILCTESVTGFTGTPLNWSSILRLSQNSAPIESFSGHLTISGGALHEKQLCALAKLFPRARLIKTYGQTETFRTLAEARQNKISANSLGRPIANVRALLLDEDLRPCAQGEVGQLVHLGDGRMNGYYCDLEASRQKEFVLGVEAGILTGDFFRQNEEGDFEFVGRRDDMIKRRGHRIYTSEIRNLLCELADVADAHVIDVSKGEVERLIAWLTPTPQSVLTPEIMEARCRATMAAHKVPDEFRIAENFPSTVSHKINSQKLVDEVRNSDDRR